jgi:hypothetical protein
MIQVGVFRIELEDPVADRHEALQLDNNRKQATA